MMSPEDLLRSIGIHSVVVSPVVGGWDTKLWRVRSAEGEFALRVFRAGQGGTRASEVAAMRAAEAGGIPVPRVVGEGVFDDHAYMLLSWCSGETFADALQSRPWQAVTLGRAFGQTQAYIHSLTAEELPAADWIAWAGPLAKQLRPHLERTVLRSKLLHLDYHPRNVLVANGKVSAVLDWTNARRGDPRADCARTVAILRFAPTTANPVLAPVERVIRRLFEVGWRRGYREIASIGNLLPFYAWAGAVMIEDLTPKLSQPGIPFTSADLERVRRWTSLILPK